MYDVVIRNARICDGRGTAIFDGAVGIRDGRIAEVGGEVAAGSEEIDGGGLVLAPGIIDSHTHYDAQITWDAYATPSVSLGVTTVIMGNCGFTIAPCRPTDRDLTLRNLTQVEGMSLEALRAGTKWGFETFPEYLDMLERIGTVPNVAAYCGHSSMRTYVMREDAITRVASDEEIAAMKDILREALEAGAVGFATTTNEPHNGWGGIPMPSRFADDREMRGLANTLGEAGKGLFMLTKGDKTTIPYLESLAAENGRPMMVAAMLHDPSNPPRVFEEVRQIREARERGHQLYAQVACIPLTQEFTLTGAYPFESRTHWKKAIPIYGDKAALSNLYADPAFRAGVKEDLEEGLVTQFQRQWDKMEIVEVAKPEHRHLRRGNVAEMAAAEGKHPLDWMLDFGLADDLGTLFTVQLFNADEKEVKRLLHDPSSSIALSDAGAHLSLLCDAGFGLYLLGRWVRDRQDFTLEEAVTALTSAQAQVYGIKDRGCIAPGFYADLLLFDPDTVDSGPLERAHDLPTGALRLTRQPIGVHGIWINGTRVADAKGIIANGAPPGHVLREFAA